MNLTPRDIQDKQFHDSFRGYSREEVDFFLDDVAGALDRLSRENQALQQQVAQLQEENTQRRATEEMLKRTLLVAQKTAQEAVEEARATAAATIAGAQEKAEQTVEGAERRAREILEVAKSTERDLRARVGYLKRLERQYRSRLQAFVDKLRALAETPMAPDQPAGAEAPETPSQSYPSVLAPTAPASTTDSDSHAAELPPQRSSGRSYEPTTPNAPGVPPVVSEPKSGRRQGAPRLINRTPAASSSPATARVAAETLEKDGIRPWRRN